MDISHSLKISLDRLVLIGDTEVDLVTTKNAGIVSIAATWGFRNEEKLMSLSPNYLIRSPKELMQLSI